MYSLRCQLNCIEFTVELFDDFHQGKLLLEIRKEIRSKTSPDNVFEHIKRIGK